MSQSTRARGFGGRRGRSFCRITAYTLLALFLVSLLAALLPFPGGDPARLLAVLRELIERSTLPLLALLLLYLGFEPPALPALWEIRLARLVRPLTALVVLLYLGVALAVIGVGQQLQAANQRQFDQQLAADQAGLAGLRQAVQTAASSTELRQLLEQQPPFRAVLAGAESPLANPDAPLAAQRDRAGALLERAEANLRGQDLQRRADAGGGLVREVLRLVLHALLYALFFAFGWLVWPRSLQALAEEARQARAEVLAEVLEEQSAPPEP